jgi:hypothetical protein
VGKFRVWGHDEFKELTTDDERDDRAWPVPDRRGILNPEIVTSCRDATEAAEEFAAYCHTRRDGWEWSWPVEFVVHDGESFWLVSVERETVPEFNAGRPSKLASIIDKAAEKITAMEG